MEELWNAGAKHEITAYFRHARGICRARSSVDLLCRTEFDIQGRGAFLT